MTTYRIYPYPLDSGSYQSLEIEGLVKVLDIKKHYDTAVMYALVDTTEHNKQFTKRYAVDIRVIETGKDIKNDSIYTNILDYDYINTVSFYDRDLVFHYFVRKRDPSGRIPV